VLALPWGHNIVLLEKVDTIEDRLWYARQTTIHGWSRSVLVAQIETQAHKRQGKALTNFDRTLPQPQSDLARQLLKDPYTFEFLALADDVQERQLEQSLLAHLKQFLLELGTGFAFVGNQHHLEVGGSDFYIDLLFYHLRLRCFVAIDLKTEAFQPEHAGKMNFYLAALDDLLRHASDGPSIGLILCKERNEVVVEYALRDSNRPLGVATYQLLPPEMQASLPSPEQLAAEIRKYS
jgi:predicted nuclease of restriction endonuclease-like (RecB) superfamily